MGNNDLHAGCSMTKKTTWITVGFKWSSVITSGIPWILTKTRISREVIIYSS